MTSEKNAARGKPKGDKRDRTRAALLEAARALVRETGYERTTLEAVARRAGMTTGAIYGNFKNRDELFIALAQAYWAPIVPEIRPGSSFAEKMRAFAEATLWPFISVRFMVLSVPRTKMSRPSPQWA